MSDPILKRMFNLMYPVGSIYISANSVSPQNLFGGTWEQIKDTFLLACGSKYGNGKTGGEISHTLSNSELPKTSFKIPHVAYYDDCTVSGGGYTQTRSSMDKEAQVNPVTNSGWHIMSTGGNQPHNNMPPYLAVYMWKRIA